MKKLVIVVVVLMLTGCGDKPDQEEDLRDYFSDNRFGESTDYMLYQRGFIIREEYYGVMVFFGFSDNRIVCQELADEWNINKPNAYYCKALN